jgi:flagella basal body P-ring formation protein FlgA
VKPAAFSLLLLSCAALQVAAQPQAPAVTRGQAEVRLKDAAVVHARHFTLADVAEVRADDPALGAALGAVRLGKSPRVGHAERLTAAEVQRLVRAQLGARFGAAGERIAWQGARATRLEIAAAAYDGAAIVAAAVAHATRSLEGAEIRAAEAAPALLLPAGEVTLRARDAGPARRPYSRMVVRVDVLLDGEFYRSVVVPLLVAQPAHALVARRALGAGQLVVAEDFETRPLDLAALRGEAALIEEAVGRPLARPLAAGEALLRGAVREPLAVNRGDVVTLRLKSGAVELESRALALSSGGVGQTVQVKPGASDATLLALVLSEGVVQLARGGMQ